MEFQIPADGIVVSLPQSVQFLTIHTSDEGGWRHKTCLDYMALHVHEYAPLLKRVQIAPEGRLTSTFYDWQGFGKLLLDRGIDFEVVQADAVSEDGRWTPYANSDSSEDSDRSSDEESLYSI